MSQNDVTQPSDRLIHFMVDIETFATTPDAVILSLGCCTIFPDERDGQHSYFYEEYSHQQILRRVDNETFQWWKAQSIPIPKSELYLREGLNNFSDWLLGQTTEPIIWARGTDFDPVILKHAYNEYGIPLPWKYNAVRDLRTLTKLFDPNKNFTRDASLTEHNAMCDAIFQAAHLRYILDLAGIKAA